MPGKKRTKRVGIITLGCDKNTVDNEYLAGLLEQEGFKVSFIEDYTPENDVDIVIINTCGFILDAKKESIDRIASLVQHKSNAQKQFKLYVYGCLAQRYAPDIIKTFPEIDGLVGVGQLETLVQWITNDSQNLNNKPWHCLKKPSVKIEQFIPRKISTPPSYSFLKIADGCSHHCSFCAIPKIKGPYRSTPMDIVLQEAEYLIQHGIKELNLIAQDITRYGTDLKQGYGICELLKELSSLKGDFWIRCLYCQPSGITKKMMNTIAETPKIVPYLDIPIQHTHPQILKLMRRSEANKDVIQLIKTIREHIPEVVLRTTIIVGFPGETYTIFKSLLQTIEQIRFERLGAFVFSPEEDTPAESLPKRVGKVIAERRYHLLMEAQSEISYSYNQSRVGKTYPVLIDDYDTQRKLWIGRSYAEAPEVDGVIFVQSPHPLQIGNFYTVRITSADIYDLYGEPTQTQE